MIVTYDDRGILINLTINGVSIYTRNELGLWEDLETNDISIQFDTEDFDTVWKLKENKKELYFIRCARVPSKFIKYVIPKY